MKTEFNLQDKLVDNSVFMIGSVFSVKGKDIVIKVDKNKNLPHLFFKGRTVKNVSVGLSNYVKILKGFTEIICKVEGEYLEEDKYQKNKEYISEKQKIERFLNVSVFGFYDNDHKFQHGIKEMPLTGSECRLLSREEFESLHKLSSENELSITLGSLIDEEIQDISISVKKLFAGHIGIFGNTGSGKSNTLAKMYTELFNLENLDNNVNLKEKSKFIFIDFNGEYSKEGSDEILTKDKKVYRLRTKDNMGDKYPIFKKEIEKLELLSILLDATEKTQQPFLHRAIDRDWIDECNQNHKREIVNINKRLKDILTMKDKNFNVPFLKKYVNDFEQLGFKIVNKGKNIDDLKYHGNDNCSFYYTNNKGRNIYADSSEDCFMGVNGYMNTTINSESILTNLHEIQFKILDQYYYEILNGYANQEHISPLIGRMKKRFDMLNKVFEISESLESKDKNINDKNINDKNINDKNINDKNINDKNINDKNINDKNINDKNINDKNINDKNINDKNINDKNINDKNINDKNINDKNINDKNINDKNINDKNINDKNIEVIDLKNVNLEIKKVIPLLICKTNYDEQKNKIYTDKENSLNIIIDEAHNILSENSTRESESWKDYRLETFEEIIKEGRKFSTFLTVASQRPSDISPTIISQIHNYFIHRLMNENDLRAINKAVSYLDKLSFDSISNLSTGCCFIAGQMTQFPLSVKVQLLDEDKRPQSETIDLDKLWKK